MNKPNQITGDWIKLELKKASKDFQAAEEKEKNNIFTYHDGARVFNARVKYLRSICPHEFDIISRTCVYCGQMMIEN